LLKAVIFDMDGVIVDSEPVHKKVERILLAPYGINPSDEELNSYMGIEAKVLIAMYIRKYDMRISFDDLYSAYKKHLIQVFSREIRAIPSAVGLIHGLKQSGLKLALGSSAHRDLVLLVLETLNLAEAFDAVVSGDDVLNGKPNPDIFLEAAKRLGCTPEECAVIEDSRNGVIAAKAAGMACAGYQNPNSFGQDLRLADWIVYSLDELDAFKLRQMVEPAATSHTSIRLTKGSI
jgi:HAD superfamily hydrolase (TIGR01509 family)